jgi:hypothetical protein
MPFKPKGGHLLRHEAYQEHNDGKQDEQHCTIRDARVKGDVPDAIGHADE